MRLRFLLALALLMAPLAPAAAAPAPDPAVAVDLIHDTFDESVQALRRHQNEIRQDPAVAYRLIDQILAPHLDFELMARLVLGAHWRNASTDQRRRFVAAFREALLRSYSLVLSSNVDTLALRLAREQVVLEMRPLRASENPRRVTVGTLLRLDERSVPIDYRMYARGNDWRVYDVLIAGISFIANYRVEYSALLRQQSLDTLIENLRHGRQKAWRPPAGTAAEPPANEASRPPDATSP